MMRVVKNLSQQNFPSKWNTPLSNYACAIRPVAAIMVTKIDGFMALAENDQDTSLLLLANSHKLQEYYANQFGCTRMVKMGELVLTAFNSADQAVKCALKIERGAKKMFNHKLRIGIHMGEVRYVDGDLFGGPVNIAQDILNVAKPGEILVSESVARSIDSMRWQVEAHGTSGPMAISTFSVKAQADRQVYHIWNYQGKNLENHFEPGEETQKMNYGS